jgi:hypothetical protein
MNNRLSALTRDAWIAIALAFVLGLFVGWLFLGWYLFPVQYTNADPWDLKPSAKEQYVEMVADSFAVNHDLNLARNQLRGFKTDELTSMLRDLIAQRNQAGQGDEAARLGTFGVSYGLALTTTPGTSPAPASGSASLLASVGPWLLLLLLVIVVVVLAFLFYPRFRGQGAMPSTRSPRRIQPPYEETPAAPRPMGAAAAAAVSTASRTAPISVPTPQPAPRPAAGGKSLGTFAATYKFGDDNYDTAFTLETARNEFLGECGMGISETVGEGKPDKVTAFDLWLFDKTDVRTVTQILMTEHAYGDQTLRSRLAQKGELTLAEKGKHIPLQTATLRVDATIVDLVYASTPGLPPNSHFQKLIVEMVATQK